MLHVAAYWRDGEPKPTPAQMRRDDHIARYMDGWGREGDMGVIAHDRRRMGAAWARLWPEDRHGWGYISPQIPEISVAVLPENRGMGIGSLLLRELIGMASNAGFHSLSLSVESDNPARRLYERLGFVRVHLEAGAWTMRRDSLVRR
jgi:ribosomal protein S18 acetylase RimI-like enzyme